MPDQPSTTSLAAHPDDLGLRHGGVHTAGGGWVLPMLHDPDGHEVRFYTHARGEDAPSGPHHVHDPGPDMRVEPLCLSGASCRPWRTATGYSAG